MAVASLFFIFILGWKCSRLRTSL